MGSRLFTLSPPCISHILKQFFCKKIVIPAQAGTGSKKLLTLLNFFPQKNPANWRVYYLFGIIFISTRLFRLRPLAVVLDAIGLDDPIPITSNLLVLMPWPAR